jgi:hypothetical protein
MDIHQIISDAENCNHILSYPIWKFSILELSALTELAKNNTVKIELRAEHSNFHQGTLVEVYKWPLPWNCDFNNMPLKEKNNA